MEDNSTTKPFNNISVFNSIESLMQFFNDVEGNAKFVVDKIWASVKFFTTITSVLLTTSVALYGSDNLQKMLGLNPNLKSLILAVIPIIVIMISMIGMKNLKREYRRFLEWVVVINKLQELLGLHEEVRTNLYSKDRYILPEHFVLKDYGSSEDFVNSGLRKKGTLYYYFNILHRSYVIIAIIITLLILYGPLQLCLQGIIKICS